MPTRKSNHATTPAIRLRGCRQHNLKSIDVDIPLGKFTVITGPSGSGKSSLAFHTLYAEGQRRYVETFSPYVRQFFDRMDKPEADSIEGIPPAIAIEQKNHVRTTRSTIGTLTEINDYLKLLFPRLAIGYDPVTGEEIRPDSPESAAAWALNHGRNLPILITFPLQVGQDANPEEIFSFLHSQGFLRVLHKEELLRTDEPPPAALSAPLSEVDVLQDRFKLTPANQSRLSDSLEAAFRYGKGNASIHIRESSDKNSTRTFSTRWINPSTGFSLRPPTPGLFSFNSPIGACPKCRGFGRIIGLDPEKAIPDPSLSIKRGAIKPFQGERGQECRRDLLRHCRERDIDVHAPWQDLDQDTRDWIYYGDSRPSDPGALEELWEAGGWYGIQGFFDWLETKTYKMHVRVFLSRYRSYTTCPTCRGGRLQPEALCFKINGFTLPQLSALPVTDLLPWFSSLPTSHPAPGTASDPTLELVLTEITSRLHFLDEVGLGYLTLDRPTRTLSGGEIERVNLTTCLGASLTGTLFVLDEPTVGLHPRDTARLVSIIHGLRDKGNTIVVVEHESAVMRAADHLIDLGPAAGQSGGTIIYQGPPFGGLKPSSATQPDSSTSSWLSGKRQIPVPTNRPAPSKKHLKIEGASRHNLRNLSVKIPLQRFVCLTGVSGSGKSTLAHDVIYQNLARRFGADPEGDAAPVRAIDGIQHLTGVELIDQSAVARTPRSTPAVFLGAFDPIRQLFACTPEAKQQGLPTGYFSFNSGDGRCDRCSGNGSEKIEMQFLSDLYVTCPDCEGRRYKPSTLEIHYLGKSIHDILDLTVTAAIDFYSSESKIPPAHQKRHQQIITLLAPLLDVGLGYLKLGQPLNTLSGGESQRLKLCQLLANTVGRGGPAAQTNPKLLILDEPTTGLHFSDIENLLKVFRALVQSGHSLLVIEHNLDVIKSADWILDLGPEAGARGGQLIAQGTPEQIATQDSPTGHYLKAALRKSDTPVAASKKSRGTAAKFPLLTSHSALGTQAISLRGARHHNLKNISLDIPRDQLVVISGLSGSGKSTLAFDILFAEGQRRFLESMSAYARQFADQLEKPDIDQLQGLPPTVAIEQRVSQGGGKSTVATVTEIWNFVRLLYSKLGTCHCPDCHVPVEKQSLAAIEKTLRNHLKQGPVILFAPIIRGRKGYHSEVAAWASKQGFSRLLVDSQIIETSSFTRLERFKEHDIDVVITEVPGEKRRVRSGKNRTKQPPLTSDFSLGTELARALEIGRGLIRILTPDKKFLWLSTHSACPSCNQSFDDLDPRLFSFNSPHGWCRDCRGHGQVPKRRIHLDTSRYESVLEAEIAADRSIERLEDCETVLCPSCMGSRLNPIASHVRLGENPSLSVSDLSSFTIDQAARHFSKLKFPSSRQNLIARDILPEIHQRLTFLSEVGLGYLQLNRSGNTLSGGEAQRIRLAAQLGSNLRGVLYVLDEPTIGLHPRDNAALLSTLTKLRNHGNSLIIVEHDEDTIASADHLIDLGPAAGRFGGEIVYQGPPPKISNPKSRIANPHSPTLRALTNPLSHPTLGHRRPIPKSHPCLTLTGCHANNLKHIDVSIPIGRLTVLTGISGSGKSTLMHQCLAVAAAHDRRKSHKKSLPFQSSSGFDKIKACHEVDQSPIGKTSRSCPATYVKVFDHIRDLFAQLPESRVRGHNASRFSFNTEGGRCPDCKGNGRIKLEMDFLPSTWIDCETCDGLRYNNATLEIQFRGKSIGQILEMSIDEAATFFESQPRIAAPLQLLADTGLGYLKLGQPSPTLSGGEAQRIKLVAELIKGRGAKARLTNKQLKISNLYLIEEPTVGLHHEDIRRLINVLHRLVDEGHTVVVIEHHMAIAAEADWILDLGPEAGDHGGTIVIQGPPEKIIRSKKSATAPFLKATLQPDD